MEHYLLEKHYVNKGFPTKDLPKENASSSFNDQISRIFPNSEKKAVRPITFQVTDNCNLCCSYCYQINKGVKKLPFETAKKFIDYLLSSTSENNSYINPDNTLGINIDFIGGEPFLEVELMDKICEYFVDQMILLDHPWKDVFRISVGSNGTLYFNENVQNFIKKYNNILSMTITIDGNKALHDACRVFPDGSGSYDLAVAAAMDYRKLSNADNIQTKLTIAPGNIDYFYDAIINLIDLGYTTIHSNPVFEDGWTLDHAKIYYSQLKKIADYIIDNDLFSTIKLAQVDLNRYYPLSESDNKNWCGGDGSMLSINPDGYMFNCVRYMESSLGDKVPPLYIGDIENGIGATDLYKDNIKCMQCINRRSQSTDECFYCPIAAGCSWCSAYNYQLFGTPNKRATFICELHKAESLINTYYFNKYAETKMKDDVEYSQCRLSVNCPYDWAVKIIGEEEYEMLCDLARMDRKQVYSDMQNMNGE